MFHDLRFACRSLLKSRGFAFVAILILTLGIGANTAVFSAFNAVLLRSLPVPDPQNLRSIAWSTNAPVDWMMWVTAMEPNASGNTYDALSYPTYESFRDRASGFTSVFAFAGLDNAMVKTRTAPATTEEGLFVSGNFFEGYGGRPLMGRLLNAQDDRQSAAPVAVISHRFWAERFALDPNVIGQTLAINQINLEIVGVLPRDYRGPLAGDPTRFYIPMAVNAVLPRSSLFPIPPLHTPSLWSLQVMGRRDVRIDEQQAQASLDLLFKQSVQALGITGKPNVERRIVMTAGDRGAMSSAMVQQHLMKPLAVLAAATLSLLLLTCANLACLVLARASRQERERAIRAAMGAGRWRLMRQTFCEVFVLAAVGCLLGTLAAAWGISAAESVLPALLPLPLGTDFQIALDARVLAFALGISFLTAVLCGCLPAWRSSRVDPLSGMKQSPVASRQAAAKTLICAQVALSVLLLVGAGLFLRTFINLANIDKGFDEENVLIFDVAPGQLGYSTEARKTQFLDSVTRSIAGIPGVQGVSVSDQPLLSGRYRQMPVTVREQEDGSERPTHVLNVGDAFLTTMRVPLLSGREFSSLDTADSEPVAVVNEEFARRYLGGRNPVGESMTLNKRSYRIVGLARDSLFSGIKDSKLPLILLSIKQNPNPSLVTFSVRSNLPASTLTPAIGKAVAAVDPEVPVNNVRTQVQQVAKQISTERILAAFSVCIAVVAVVLSGFGLFGLLAYFVTRRTNEIGVRTALGAQQWDVIKLVVGQGMAIVVLGTIVGCLLVLWGARLLSGFLFGVEAFDPLTLAAALALLTIVAALATYLPARRAAKIDPLTALRTE